MIPEDWLYILIGVAFLTGWIAAWSIITILDGLTHVADDRDPLDHDRPHGRIVGMGSGEAVAWRKIIRADDG